MARVRYVVLYVKNFMIFYPWSWKSITGNAILYKETTELAWTYLKLPLRQWGVGNDYLLVWSSWKVDIAENPITVMGF